MKPYLSVIILSYNRCADVLALLKSLSFQTYRRFEIILVDNNSADETLKQVLKNWPKIKVLALKKNYGRSGHNYGARQALGKVLVFLDADVLVPKKFLQKVADKFLTKKIEAVSFFMKDPQGKYYGWEPTYKRNGNSQVGYESTFGGGMWAIRKKVFEDVGGFNPDFFVYVDEWEYLIRMWQKNYSVRYFPDLIGWHKETPYAYRSIMAGYHVIINHAQIYALYLPVKYWPKFLAHHSFEYTKGLAKGSANRWGMIKGLVLAGWFFIKALPKRKVLKGRALKKFLRFYFPGKNEMVVGKWGWIKN